MRIAIISGTEAGHPQEIAPLLFKGLSNFIPYIDTISSFPEKFSNQNSEYSNHFYLSQKNYDGSDKNISDIYQDISLILNNQKKYDYIFILTLDELFNLNQSDLNTLSASSKNSKIFGVYYSSSYWRIEEKREWCKFREQKINILNIDCVFSPDPFLELYHNKLNTTWKIWWTPDISSINLPLKSSNIISDINLRKGNRKVIGLVGSLGKWKGILQLLQSLIDDISLTKQYFFVISGKIVEQTFSKEELDFIKKTLNRLNDLIYYIPYNIDSNEDFNDIINTCDYLYCYYLNPQSSGILSKSILLNKLIIGSNRNYIGDMLKTFPEIGIGINEMNSYSLRESLKKLDEHNLSNTLNTNLIYFRKILNPDIMVDQILYYMVKNNISIKEQKNYHGFLSKNSFSDLKNFTTILFNNNEEL